MTSGSFFLDTGSTSTQNEHMGIFEILILAFAESMDAFAVSLIQGLCATHNQGRYALKVGFFFGFFQGLMTLIGFFLAKSFSQQIQFFDHWIAFILLSIVGAKMFYEGLQPKDFNCEVYPEDDTKKLLIYAIATSIDALAIGVSLAFIIEDIFPVFSGITVVTFALSALGVLIGKRFAILLDNKAELFGGVTLVLMGINILYQHLS